MEVFFYYNRLSSFVSEIEVEMKLFIFFVTISITIFPCWSKITSRILPRPNNRGHHIVNWLSPRMGNDRQLFRQIFSNHLNYHGRKNVDRTGYSSNSDLDNVFDINGMYFVKNKRDSNLRAYYNNYKLTKTLSRLNEYDKRILIEILTKYFDKRDLKTLEDIQKEIDKDKKLSKPQTMFEFTQLVI